MNENIDLQNIDIDLRGGRKGNGARQTKVAVGIRKLLSEFLLRERIVDPDTKFNVRARVDTTLISITDVVMSSCLRHAKVFVVSLSNDFTKEDSAIFLQRHSHKLRHYIATHVHMKFVPELRFFVDDSFENASRIDALFKKLEAR